MRHITINGTEIPKIGYGTWQVEGKTCVECVQVAIDTGYRHIDTAQIYKNEEHVGEGIKRSGIDRSELFLTTKIWTDNFGKDKFEASLDESLKKLQTDYVDMLLLHWPSDDHDMHQTLDLLMKAKENGKVQNIGVSNYTVDLIQKAHKHTNGCIINNQVEFHPFINQQPVYEAIKDLDMFITAYSPLARGDVMQNGAISDIADRHDKSPGQIALRWAIQHEYVAAIPKSSTPDHIKDNFKIFDFSLSDEEMTSISDQAREDGRKVNPDFAPKWDTAKAA